MKKLLHTFLAALLLLSCLLACRQEGRVIPKSTMAKMYVDMFMADQWLKDHNEVRTQADTTLFFDPIFHKYGYTFKDYNRSIFYYSSNIEKLEDITALVVEELKEKAEYYKDMHEADLEAKRTNEANRIHFKSLDFSTDSLRLALIDSAWYRFFMRDSLDTKDSLALVYSLSFLDSLLTKDSLALKDSLFKTDSLAVKDSLLINASNQKDLKQKIINHTNISQKDLSQRNSGKESNQRKKQVQNSVKEREQFRKLDSEAIIKNAPTATPAKTTQKRSTTDKELKTN